MLRYQSIPLQAIVLHNPLHSMKFIDQHKSWCMPWAFLGDSTGIHIMLVPSLPQSGAP